MNLGHYDDKENYDQLVDDVRKKWSVKLGIKPKHCVPCHLHLECRCTEKCIKILCRECELIENELDKQQRGVHFKNTLQTIQRFCKEHFSVFNVTTLDAEGKESDQIRGSNSVQGTECIGFWKTVEELIERIYPPALILNNSTLQKRKRLLLRAMQSMRFILGLSRLDRLLSGEEIRTVKILGEIASYCFKELYSSYSTHYMHDVTVCLHKTLKNVQSEFGVSLGKGSYEKQMIRKQER